MPAALVLIVRGMVRITTAVVLLFSLSLHWTLLQTVAWTGMLISYSREGSLGEAITKTFDGEHPCPLCKAIQSARTAEKKSEQPNSQSQSKTQLAVVWQASEVSFVRAPKLLISSEMHFLGRAEEPPKPRPRVQAIFSTIIS